VSAPGAFGDRMKQEREARGVGLDELSRATKIRRVFLEALEGERWGELPSRVFVVGYLRAIADHLHADSAALQRALEEAWPLQEEPAEVDAREQEERGAGARWVWGAVAFVGVAAGVAVWVYLRPVPPSAAPPAPSGAAAMSAQAGPEIASSEAEGGLSPAEGPGATAPPPRALESPLSAPAPEVAGPASGTPAPAAPAPKTLAAPTTPVPAAPSTPHGDLWIEVSGPCWMELYAGDRRLVFRQVQAGERLSFDGRGFSLTLGDAAACRVFWKGSAVSLPTKSGSVARGILLGEARP